ncbi:hypothetical protein Bbad01_26030 [Bacillus badius]|nr:hypothetical protein Bbad01_26030 [Bacillus badius]
MGADRRSIHEQKRREPCQTGKRLLMRSKGDKYRPVATVLKEKNGVPTKLHISGKVYALVLDDYINGRKNQAGRMKNG